MLWSMGHTGRRNLIIHVIMIMIMMMMMMMMAIVKIQWKLP